MLDTNPSLCFTDTMPNDQTTPVSSETVLTHDEIGLAFAAHDLLARLADRLAICAMGGTVQTTAEYLWDHWLGEPETPTLEEVRETIRLVVQADRDAVAMGLESGPLTDLEIRQFLAHREEVQEEPREQE